MTALWIVLGVLAFLLLLLFIPVTLTASYEDGLKAKARYLFLTFQIAPPKEKKRKKRKKKQEPPGEEPAPKESKIKQLIKEQGLSGFLHMMKELAVLAAGAAKDVLRHLKIKRLDIDVTVVGEDAADSAVNFGYACSVVYTAVGMLTALSGCKKYHVSVVPGFEAQKSQVAGYAKVSLAPAFALAAAIKALVKYFKLVLIQKKQETLNTGKPGRDPKESA